MDYPEPPIIEMDPERAWKQHELALSPIESMHFFLEDWENANTTTFESYNTPTVLGIDFYTSFFVI